MDTRFTCVKRRKEGCREHVGDEHGEKPLQRAASAYRICNNLFAFFMTSHGSHLEVIKRSQAKAREEIGRRKSRFA
jgi:hypothetical protein